MNGISYRVVPCTIVYTMNRDIHYWVSFSLYHSSLLCIETKSVKKNQLCTIVSTRDKQRVIPLASFGLLQQNKHFRTALEQAN